MLFTPFTCAIGCQFFGRCFLCRSVYWFPVGTNRHDDGPVLGLARSADPDARGFVREMQVDLTRYLVAQFQHPDRSIRISGDNGARLHVHENGN